MEVSIPFYRLHPRGAGGLTCDRAGVALGPVDLIRAGASPEVLSPSNLARVLRLAYGPQPEQVVHRLHCGLSRAARALRAGDLALAGIETVLLRLPDPRPEALRALDALGKWGDSWENQPRVPAGSPNGGEWTTQDGGGPTATERPHPAEGRAAAEDDEEPGRRADGSRVFGTLEQVFPGLKGEPGLSATLEPVDNFFEFSRLADDANAEATMAVQRDLVDRIQALDPSFVDWELMPPGGIDGLSWDQRANLIDGLQMQLAATTYRLRGDIGPLQVQTLRFLQQAVDKVYREAVENADTGRLQPRLSRQEAIGNYIDQAVRFELKNLYSQNEVKFGPQQNIAINSRDYGRSEGSSAYRIPDARLADVVFDWSIAAKDLTTPQVRDFFRAYSNPRAVIIIRPSQLGAYNTYLIRNPARSQP